MAVEGIELDGHRRITKRKGREEFRNPWHIKKPQFLWKISGLTRNETAKSVSRDQILRCER